MGPAEVFDQRAVLDQDRALIEQLTQRADRRERSAVRKPPAVPKLKSRGDRASMDTAPPSPAAATTPIPDMPVASEAVATAPETPAKGLVAAAGSPAEMQQGSDRQLLVEATDAPADAQSVPTRGTQSASSASIRDEPALVSSLAEEAPKLDHPLPAVLQQAVPKQEPPPATMAPVVPRSGGLFTAADIDNIMDRLGTADGKAVAGQDLSQGDEPGQCTQNFGDISNEFFQSHRMDVQKKAEEPPAPVQAPAARESTEFEVPKRQGLRDQIKAIDSWLEDDFIAREQLSEARHTVGAAPSGRGFPSPLIPQQSVSSRISAESGTAETSIFSKLEGIKQQKALGQRPNGAQLSDLANQIKPLLPGMSLEALVRALQLFCSARFEDHDLYLRILGEIPVQVRGISPELLTTCLKVLWRLRLHEETYLELFSMEAMNMIRSSRRAPVRAPRRAPAPARHADSEATKAATATGLPQPTPPAAKPQPDAPAPFNASQLIHIGNALTQLSAKHSSRFMDIYQEQLSIALPRLTQEECELVSLALATSPLMPDQLRRTFLERCAQVDAGAALQAHTATAAPDIEKYQREFSAWKQREKHFRNIFMIEASVRKETFSFFSSLPPEVRAHLDRVHADAETLKHEGTGALAASVAAVLEQLGVSCDLTKMVGPLSLHVVCKATNPRSELKEIVYECSETDAFCAPRQDDKGAVPQYTTVTKLRHKLLKRLGVQLVHINMWEWNQMSEAQRINYMVKVQSDL
eukprot:TRINITY_DN31382_c0_g1_i1.p1 TRINITY_DN31382_c0_g1~~TRINITY_DN31382_c0_g1_i1.p1  ORF type:complete len:841 (+),score=157.67 TRINITY_DN31382_c0_g1_i1:272-2524(+)